MIILDTNVVSEVLRPAPSPNVLGWLSRQPTEEIAIGSVTLAEILYGIEILPAGKRRSALLEGVELMFGSLFAERILAFDEEAARSFSRIAAERRRRGRPMSDFDAEIAAIAHVHGATLATRNTADFEGCGVRLVDPWQRT